MQRTWSFCADQGKDCNINNINRMYLGRQISHSDFILSPKLNYAQLADVWKLTRCWLGFLVSLCPLKESNEFQQSQTKKHTKFINCTWFRKIKWKKTTLFFFFFLGVHEVVSPMGASSECKITVLTLFGWIAGLLPQVVVIKKMWVPRKWEGEFRGHGWLFTRHVVFKNHCLFLWKLLLCYLKCKLECL